MKQSMFAALLFAMLAGMQTEPAAPQEPPHEAPQAAEQADAPEPVTA